jgi:two-component system CheB/CheR fusion protein
MNISEKKNASFEDLLEHLKHSRGFDFTGYKHSSLMRRIQKRMQMVPVERFADYVDYLEVHPEEFAQLFNTILINVTDFYRDALAWEYLRSEIIPRIIAAKRSNEPIRVWSAGCASGQEAYTLAVELCEALGRDAFRQRVKIYATDADEEALAQARQASYTPKEMQSMPHEHWDTYFEIQNAHYVFRNDLRRSVIFGRHDLVQDAPISRLDLLVCRNTLMYFNSETQGHILARLHFALNDTGFLFLGKAEMLLTHTNLFTPVNLKYRIFSKVDKVNLRDRLFVMAQVGDLDNSNHLVRQVRIREAAFDSAPVAQVVVDMNGIILLVNERARALLGLSAKDLGRSLRDLEVSYRPVELRSLIDQAYAERRAVALGGVQRLLPNGDVQYLDLQVAPLQYNGEALIGVSIAFQDVTQAQRLQEELRRTNQDLETAYEELQSANEELETTNEELQSANEELETTNEELQSANEELETMNEELQSSNEELQTVNEELRQRTDEYNQTNIWLQTTLAILPVGLVIVGRDFGVLMWNRLVEDLWGLRADEVKGRSFLNLDIGLPVEKLKAPMRACLNREPYPSPLVLDATNRRGKAIKCEVVLSLFTDPIREDIGVAMLMEDVTEREQNTEALRECAEQQRFVFDHLPVMVLARDESEKLIYWNRECERVTGWTAEEIAGNASSAHLAFPDDARRAGLLAEFERLDGDYQDWVIHLTCKDGAVKRVAWSNISRHFSIPGWPEWAIGVEVNAANDQD